MNKSVKGKLIIIGGAERQDEGQAVLKNVAAEMNGHKQLLIITAASHEPEGVGEDYTRIFHSLGITSVDVVYISRREDAESPELVHRCEQADGIFFTGGDQLRITSQMGDSSMYRCMRERYLDGAVIAGTSAGAAAMPYTMIIGGPGDESNRISTLSMAPGLGLLDNVVIDSHFAERGRMGRLIGAVMQNPRNLGIGIDEGTAIIVERAKHFRVIGSGAVYAVDGSNITYSSLSEAHPEGIVTVHDVCLHVLGEGDRFDLEGRRPIVVEKPESEMAAAADESG